VLELWKTIVVTVLGWPVAAVVLGLVFKRYISNLLTRATRLSLKHGDTLIEATAGSGIESASEQTEKVDKPTAASLSAPLSEPPREVDEAARQEMKDFGKGIAAVQVNEELIRNHLARFNFALDNPETAEILIRNLAFVQLLYRAERLYRLIFGSQISLLKYLNVMGAKPDVDIQPFYEKARKKFPKFYDGYPYEQWREFLIGQMVMVHDAEKDVYGINQAGKDFLGWIVHEGLSEEKQG